MWERWLKMSGESGGERLNGWTAAQVAQSAGRRLCLRCKNRLIGRAINISCLPAKPGCCTRRLRSRLLTSGFVSKRKAGGQFKNKYMQLKKKKKNNNRLEFFFFLPPSAQWSRRHPRLWTACGRWTPTSFPWPSPSWKSRCSGSRRRKTEHDLTHKNKTHLIWSPGAGCMETL